MGVSGRRDVLVARQHACETNLPKTHVTSFSDLRVRAKNMLRSVTRATAFGTACLTQQQMSSPFIKWPGSQRLCHALFGSVASGLRRPSPLTCAVDHAATFAVKCCAGGEAEAVAAPRANCSLHPTINPESEAGQAASSVFDSFLRYDHPTGFNGARSNPLGHKFGANHSSSYSW